MANLTERVDIGGIATLTLDRPDRHNAFDDAVIAELTASLERLGSQDGVRAVVLASTGRSFSAGADLEWMRRMAGYSEAENQADAEALARMLHALDRLPRPTLALVQGPAYGGGVGLVACCDVAIASERASFCLTEVKLGLTPATISPYVVNAIGPRQARRYFITAEVISAARAQEIGLVHEVVPEPELEVARDRVLGALLQGAPAAQADAKALVFLREGRAVDAALAQETSRRIAQRRASPEGREGLGAFLSKRSPSWRPTEGD
jgi:methylglutaconyl-CoA hydratase